MPRNAEVVATNSSIMFDRILRRIQQKVRALEYVMSIHAEEEMDDDELTIFDVEHILLTGEIVERQKDYRTGSGNIS